MRLNRALLLAVVASVFSGASAFAADAESLVRKAACAERNISYRGVKTAVIFMDGKPITSVMKVIHQKPDKTRTEYYSPSALAGIILIRSDDSMWRFDPREKNWEAVAMHKPVHHDMLPSYLFDNYSFSKAGRERIAGRSAHVVRAKPNAGGEPVKRFWIDETHGFILGMQACEEDGTLINKTSFRSIEINPKLSPELFKVSGKVSKPHALPASDEGVAMPGYLPKGYKQVGKSCISVNGCICTHVQFSNGMNTISMFQRDAAGGAYEKMLTGGRLLNVISIVKHNKRYTFVGALPRAELKKIADSIK